MRWGIGGVMLWFHTVIHMIQFPGMNVLLLLLLYTIVHETFVHQIWLISTPSHKPKPFQPEQKWWGTWGTHKQLSCLVPNLPCSMQGSWKIQIALDGARIMQNAKMFYKNFRKSNQIWHQDHPKATQPPFSCLQVWLLAFICPFLDLCLGQNK